MRPLLSTGIPGLDEILGGGLRSDSCLLLEGIPGVGKTTVGMQFLVSGALAGEPGVIITFEQFPEQLYADAAGFGWDLRGLEEQDALRVICTSPMVFLDQLCDVGGLIDGLIAEIGARRVLVDSVAHLSALADTPQELRPLVYGMLNGIRRAGLTAIVTKELEAADPGTIPFEEFLVDTVVRLTYSAGSDGYRRRRVEVTKSRGQDHSHGQHTLVIGDGGVSVYPRHTPTGRSSATFSLSDRVATGIRGLDDMLGGGIPRGFSLLVAGSAGVGKTSLALQFMEEGARAGETGLYVTFEEPRQKLSQLARGFGLDLGARGEEGLLAFRHETPLRLSPDRLIWELKEQVRQTGARRMVVDSLTDLTLGVTDPELFRETVYLLCDAMQELGVTLVLTSEVPELFDQTLVSPNHISIIVDGIVLMKYVELESEIERAISVLKLRGCDHDNDIRRYRIGDHGLSIASRFEGAMGVMGGSPRQAPITLSVRSFTEFDERLNADLLGQFTQLYPHVRTASLSLPYNPDEARVTVRSALDAPSTSLSVAPLSLYWLPEMVESGRLMPLDEEIPASQVAQHMPELVAPGRLNQRLFAMPALSVCGALLYRKDLLDEYGFSAPPRTWDELAHQAQTIVTGENDPSLIAYKFPGYRYEGLTTSFLQNLWSNGGEVFSEGEVALDSENARQALRQLWDAIHTHRLAPANVTTAAHGLEPQRDFLAGRVVFLTMLPTVALTAQRAGSPLQGRVGIAPHPVGPMGTQSTTFLGGWHYGIPVGARSPETAAAFIRYMTSYEVQRERCLRGGSLPTIRDLFHDPEIVAFNPDYPLLETILQTARSRHRIPHYRAISGLIQAHLHPALAEGKDPEEALTRLAGAVRELVSQG